MSSDQTDDRGEEAGGEGGQATRITHHEENTKGKKYKQHNHTARYETE